MYKKGILLIGGVLLLTTGCGSKKLTCNQTVQGIDTETTITFKDDKAELVKMGMMMDKPEDFDLDKDGDTYKKEFEEMGYKNVELKEKDDKISINVEIDVKDFLKSQNIDSEKDETITYDELKENFENANWTCK